MYKLVIKDDEANKTVIAFYRQEITIGRAEGNTIRLTEQNVSRKHAKLTKSDNIIYLEDTYSYVGTYVNDVRIEGKVQLNNGDEIKIGDYLITLIKEVEDNDETVLIKDDTNEEQKDKRIKPIPITEITGSKTTETTKTLEKDLDVSYPLKPPYNKVVFLEGNLAGTSFDIVKSVMTIGSSPETDIIIAGKFIADIEAKIICNENSVKIKEVSNKGKLKINGDTYKILELREGDEISIGSYLFRYCDKNSTYVYKPKSGASKNKFLIIGMVALVLIAGVSFFLFGSKSDENSDKPNKNDNIITKNVFYNEQKSKDINNTNI